MSDDARTTRSTRSAAGPMALVRLLARYRFVVYLGGLAAIAGTRLLPEVGVSLTPTVRTVVVGLGLAAMVVTYLGERRFVRGSSAASEDTARPVDWRTQLGLLGALVGIALGVAVALTVNLLYGALFVVGSLLFANLAVRGGRDE